MLNQSDDSSRSFAKSVFIWGGSLVLVLVGLIFLYVPEAPKSLGQEASIRDYQSGSSQSAETQVPSAPETGAAIAQTPEENYKTYCAQCHGLTGQADGPMARMMASKPPNLQSGPFKMARNPEAIAAIIRNGVGTMPGFGDEITDEDAIALGRFVLQLEAQSQ